MRFISSIINFILPPRCCICGKVLDEDKGICDECISQIEFLNKAVCYRCGAPMYENEDSTSKKIVCGSCLKQRHKSMFKMVRSAYVYDDFSKKLILDLKFYDKTDVAPLLARMLYVAGKDIFAEGIDLIMPVPLHYTGLIKRHYNQSALLAKELGKLTKTKVEYTNLTKTKITKPQVECDGIERLSNLKDVFTLKDKNKIKGKNILLVDDVLTTGSTLKECAKAVKSAKPYNIYAITVARSIN